jgi:hypothetical protein
MINQAFAAASDVVETSFTFAVLSWMRDHPGATFLAILVLLAAFAMLTTYVVRRVRREAREYYDTGVKGWGRFRQRVTRFGHREDEAPGVGPTPPATPSNVHRLDRRDSNRRVI